MSPVYIAHRGTPCTPPIVDDGIEFFPHPEDCTLFVAACTEEQAADLTRIPAFTRFGGDLTKLAPATPSGEFVPYDFAKPVFQWTNVSLLARATETWDTDVVKAKAVELGIESLDAVDRTALMALVTAGKPQE